jgi:hypothetical protein
MLNTFTICKKRLMNPYIYTINDICYTDMVLVLRVAII